VVQRDAEREEHETDNEAPDITGQRAARLRSDAGVEAANESRTMLL
jgi:hypothetical protein